MRSLVGRLSLSVLILAACSDNAAGPVDAGASDAGSFDASIVDAATVDAMGGAIVAVPGERCAMTERVGLVEIQGSQYGVYVTADLRDAPRPDVAAPTLSTATCNYYKFNPSSSCAPCSAGEVCDLSGTCVDKPARLTQATLTITSEGQQQVFAPMGDDDAIGGTITLPGDSFALTLDAYGQQITLVETLVPDALEGVEETLVGGSQSPSSLDISWNTPEDAEVHTLININHHVFEPTFTDCHVQASTGTMHIDGDMLMPLAVVTGLEFQGVDHMRFAAADTPSGCVEFRYSRRTFPSL